MHVHLASAQGVLADPRIASEVRRVPQEGASSSGRELCEVLLMRQQMSNLIKGLEPNGTHVVGFGGSMDERARGWELGASTVLGQRYSGEDKHLGVACKLEGLGSIMSEQNHISRLEILTRHLSHRGTGIHR